MDPSIRALLLVVLPWSLPACAPSIEELEGRTLAISASSDDDDTIDHIDVTLERGDTSAPITVTLVRSLDGTWNGVLDRLSPGRWGSMTARALDAAGQELGQLVWTDVEVPESGFLRLLIVLELAPGDPSRDDPPAIELVALTGDRLAPGEETTLSVRARDDGPASELEYLWTATGGGLAEPRAPTTRWTAPPASGTYTVTVQVRDGARQQRCVTLTLSVSPRGSQSTVFVAGAFNHWPEIRRFVASPSVVAPGARSTLTVEARDLDRDGVTHTFSDDCGGRFEGQLWHAPWISSARAECTVRVLVSDGRGGLNHGELGLVVAPPEGANHPPRVTSSFQSTDRVDHAGDVVHLEVTAEDPDGDALSFEWSASSGTLGSVETSQGESAVAWSAGASSATVMVVIRDARGAGTAERFEVTYPSPGG